MDRDIQLNIIQKKPVYITYVSGILWINKNKKYVWYQN